MSPNLLFSSAKFYCSTQNLVSKKKFKFSCIHMRRKREGSPGVSLCYGLSFPLLPKQTRQGAGTKRPPILCASMAVFEGLQQQNTASSHLHTCISPEMSLRWILSSEDPHRESSQHTTQGHEPLPVISGSLRLITSFNTAALRFQDYINNASLLIYWSSNLASHHSTFWAVIVTLLMVIPPLWSNLDYAG